MFTPGAWNGAIYAKGEALELGVAGTQLSPELDLSGGRLDIEMWSHWRNGLQRLAGAVSAADMRVALRSADKTAAPAQPAPVLAAESPPAPADDVAAAPPVEHLLAVADAQGRFQWQRSADGWALDADHVSIRHEQGMAVSPAEWRVVYWQDAQSRHVEAGVCVVLIEHFLPLLREAGALPADQDVRLAALAPRGELRDGYLRYQWGGATSAALLLRSDFRELAWTAAELIPGVSGLNGSPARHPYRRVGQSPPAGSHRARRHGLQLHPNLRHGHGRRSRRRSGSGGHQWQRARPHRRCIALCHREPAPGKIRRIPCRHERDRPEPSRSQYESAARQAAAQDRWHPAFRQQQPQAHRTRARNHRHRRRARVL